MSRAHRSYQQKARMTEPGQRQTVRFMSRSDQKCHIVIPHASGIRSRDVQLAAHKGPLGEEIVLMEDPDHPKPSDVVQEWMLADRNAFTIWPGYLRDYLAFIADFDCCWCTRRMCVGLR